MKIFFLIFLSCSLFCVQAQEKVIKYYDSEWAASTKEKATYYAEFVKEGMTYSCTSYWIKTNVVRGKSTYRDTIMAKPIGLQTLYYKNGNIEDSSYYNTDGFITDAYHYYENKQLAAHYYLSANKKEGITEGFDETGKKIKNYVFGKEAEFKGGEKAWHSYLLKNVTKDFQNTKDNTDLTLVVHVQFIVDEYGNVTKPKVIKSSGLNYVDRDAERVILSSPSWKNAIQFNKPVKAYRIQPFTYILTAAKKTK